MNKDDKDRLQELQEHVWRKVAIKLLLNTEKDPYILSDNMIENHRGRQKKAIRLLTEAGIITVHKKSQQKYDSNWTYYNILNFDSSKAFAEPCEFPDTWEKFYNIIFRSPPYSKEEFDVLGYEPLNRFHNNHVLYIYWHQDEYDVVTYQGVKNFYPKALREVRIKAILRAIVENFFQKNFHNTLEKYLGLPEGSIREDDFFTIQPRNFGAYASRFTAEKYQDYRNEYVHYRKYFEGLIHYIDTFNRIIQEKGGYAVIIEEMRRTTIQTLLEDAPLYINYDSENEISDYDKLWKKYSSIFILKHSNYFDYDTLYADDTSIQHIKGDQVFRKEDTPDVFEPTEDTVNIIKKMEEEQTLCSAKTI